MFRLGEGAELSTFIDAMSANMMSLMRTKHTNKQVWTCKLDWRRKVQVVG